jgi:mxaA protein
MDFTPMRSVRISMPDARRRVRAAVALLLAVAMLPTTSAQTEPVRLQARTLEPRAFGHRVGDVVGREVLIDIPSRYTLDETSLPVPGPQGLAFELRSMAKRSHATATGRRVHLRLDYQVFAAPVAVRTYELPGLRLRFDGGPRVEELRVDPWPLVVAPLAGEQVSHRDGLGELRPDSAPLMRGTTVERALLWLCAVLALGLAGYLALVYVGLPWQARRSRPFAQAFAMVRAHAVADWPLACRALHAAFDQTAGRTVFADSIPTFVAQAPRFATLQGDIGRFFAGSQAGFFGGEAPAPTPPSSWLLGFARACRDAERGSA